MLKFIKPFRSQSKKEALSNSDSISGIMVSFPKSGRTWARVMLDQLGIALKYTHAGSAHIDGIHLANLKIECNDYKDHKCIFLHRDPRDVVVSGFFQAKHRKNIYSGNLKSFLRSPCYGIEKVIVFNKMWFDFVHEKNMHVFSYEQLHIDTFGQLSDLIRYLNIENIDAVEIEKAVNFAAFENLQKLERMGILGQRYGKKFQPADPNKPETFKARRGKVAGYVDYLDSKDIEYCEYLLKLHSYFESVPKTQ